MLSRRSLLAFALGGAITLRATPGFSAGNGNGKGGEGKGNSGGNGGGEGKGNGNSGGRGNNGKGAGSGANGKGKGKARSGPAAASRAQPVERNAVFRVKHGNGFTETMAKGRYVLKDNRGRTIVDRAATAKDYARLSKASRPAS